MRQNILMQMINRFASENPKFWKIISAAGFVIALIISGVLLLDEFKILAIPDNWLGFLKGADCFFIGMFVTGQMGTTDPDLMDTKTKINVKQDSTLS